MALGAAPIPETVDPHKPFVLEIDASNSFIGAILLQDGRLVAYESRKLDRAQQNYSAYECELLCHHSYFEEMASLFIWCAV